MGFKTAEMALTFKGNNKNEGNKKCFFNFSPDLVEIQFREKYCTEAKRVRERWQHRNQQKLRIASIFCTKF